jgi:hypothetical protein
MTNARSIFAVAMALAVGALGYWHGLEYPGAVVNAGLCAVAAWVLMQTVYVQADLQQIIKQHRMDLYELMRQSTTRAVESTILQRELTTERSARKADNERARTAVGRLKDQVGALLRIVAAYETHGMGDASASAITQPLRAVRDELSIFGHTLDIGPDTVPNPEFQSMRGQV